VIDREFRWRADVLKAAGPISSWCEVRFNIENATLIGSWR